jgi:uncharacterized membrane protein HdeD (DUF308 family)
MNAVSNTGKPIGWNMKGFGVLAIVLGVLAMCMPGLTGQAIIIAVAVMVVLGGIVRMLWAFQASSLGRGVLMFAVGGLTLLCGVLLLANPLLGSGLLSILLAVYFVLDGLAEIAGALRVRPASGWGWFFAGGVVSILLGIMMWRQFPLSGAWAIGILLGVKLILIGTIMLTVGSALRAAASR